MPLQLPPETVCIHNDGELKETVHTLREALLARDRAPHPRHSLPSEALEQDFQ